MTAVATILAFHGHTDDEVLFTGGTLARLFRLLIALPAPVFGLLGGREWFAERGAAATTVSGNILAPADRYLTPTPPSECTTVPVIPRARSEARNT